MHQPAVTAKRWVLLVAGLALGTLMAFAELAYFLLGGGALAVPAARSRIFCGARRLADAERRRLAHYLGNDNATDYSGRRALEYLGVRWIIGLVGAGILFLIAYGAMTGVIIIGRIFSGTAPGGDEPLDWYDPIVVLLVGLLLTFLCIQGLSAVATMDRRLARHFLGPSPQELLRRRVTELRYQGDA